MSDSEDRIPSWVGRAVTTAEVPASLETPSDTWSRPQLVVFDTIDVSPRLEPAGTFDSSPLEDDTPPAGSKRTLLMVGAVLTMLAVVIGGLGLSGALTDRTDSQMTGSADFESTAGTDTDRSTTGDTDADTSDEESADAAGEDAADTDAGETTASSEQSDQADAPSVPGVSPAVIDAHRGEAWAAGEAAWAIFVGGKIYVQGQVPDMEAAGIVTGRLQSILGPDIVVTQYSVDPTSPRPVDPPLFIKETVVFDPQATTMAPGSDWILVVTDVLMKRFPATTLTVVTDLTAPVKPGDGVELADQRVEAIVDYLVDRGIDPARIGSEERDEDLGGVEAGNKPIEFVVRGLLAETG